MLTARDINNVSALLKHDYLFNVFEIIFLFWTHPYQYPQLKSLINAALRRFKSANASKSDGEQGATPVHLFWGCTFAGKGSANWNVFAFPLGPKCKMEFCLTGRTLALLWSKALFRPPFWGTPPLVSSLTLSNQLSSYSRQKIHSRSRIRGN